MPALQFRIFETTHIEVSVLYMHVETLFLSISLLFFQHLNYPEVDVTQDFARSSLSKESARSAFLEHDETLRKRLLHAWYDVFLIICGTYENMKILHIFGLNWKDLTVISPKWYLFAVLLSEYLYIDMNTNRFTPKLATKRECPFKWKVLLRRVSQYSGFFQV